MTPILPDRLCWSSALGNFIINFGMLDYLVFEFLELHLPLRFAAGRREHLQNRIVCIKRHVRESDYSAEQKERFEIFFHRIEPIRELRNHIAHGHLLVRQDADTGKFVMTLSQLRSLDAADALESRHLDFAELEKALSDLRDLIEEFMELTSGPGKKSTTVAPQRQADP